MSKAARSPDFEKSLGELERLVERLESGELPLDEAATGYELMDRREALKVMLRP